MRREATFGSFSIRIRLQEVLFLATRSLSTVVPNVIDTGTLPGLGLVVFSLSIQLRRFATMHLC